MNPRGMKNCVIVFVCAALAWGAMAQQQASPPARPPSEAGQFTNGLPGPINLPLAPSAVDDWSCAAADTSNVNSELATLRDKLQKNDGLSPREALNQLEQLRTKLPPEEILSFRVEVRRDSDSTLVAPSVLYANNLSSLDLGFQTFLSGAEGFGLGLRFDLLNVRRPFLRNLADLSSALGRKPDNNGEREVEGIVDAALALTEKTAQSYTRMALQPQVAGVVGYRDLTDFGTVTNFGVSASWLRPLGHSTQDAVSGGFSVLATGQSVHLNATGQPTRSFPRWGVALAIQDKIPYYEGEGRGISRWQWKGGVEYQGPGGDDIGETYGLFVRYRPLSGGNDHPQPVEYGLSLGRGPMQETLVGLSIAATVRL